MAPWFGGIQMTLVVSARALTHTLDLGIDRAAHASTALATAPLSAVPPLSPARLPAIGVATFAMATGGMLAGRLLGSRIGRVAEALAGLALIALGSSILFEHLGV